MLPPINQNNYFDKKNQMKFSPIIIGGEGKVSTKKYTEEVRRGGVGVHPPNLGKRGLGESIVENSICFKKHCLKKQIKIK